LIRGGARAAIAGPHPNLSPEEEMGMTEQEAENGICCMEVGGWNVRFRGAAPFA